MAAYFDSAREMVQWSRAFAVFAENLDSISNTHMEAHNNL